MNRCMVILAVVSLPASWSAPACAADDAGTARKLEKPKTFKDGKYTRKDLYDGVSYGQFNAYLSWKTDDLVDEPNRWEITVYLIDEKRRKAPKDECTVDITPRRLRKLAVKPGMKYKWTNRSVKEDKEVQSGVVVADKWGLLTVKKLTVGKGKNRIAIIRQ